MKWILAILLFFDLSAIAQTNDSTKYIWYKTQYGLRQSRVAADSFSQQPYLDTTGMRGFRPGAIMMHTDKKFYKWDGANWIGIGSAIQLTDSSFKVGNDTITIRGTGGGGSSVTPGAPSNSIQFNDSGFKGDSLFFYPALNQILNVRNYLQYGRPVRGFWQDSALGSSGGYLWKVYSRGSGGAGADSLQYWYSRIETTKYDAAWPENTVFTLLGAGEIGGFSPFASIRLEQNFYNDWEYHAFTTKPRLVANTEIRHWSWNVSRTTGYALLQTRSAQNVWKYADITNPMNDQPYLDLNPQGLKMYTWVGAEAGISSVHGINPVNQIGFAITNDTGAFAVKFQPTALAQSLILGTGINMLNPSTTGGYIGIKKDIRSDGHEIRTENLPNSVVGLSVLSSAIGYVHHVDIDGSGYATVHTIGSHNINRDPGISTSTRMLAIYNNYNPNDSIFHVRGNGDAYFKGMITANADSTTSATGGFIYRDAATGNFRITAGGSSSYTFTNGLTESSGTVKLGGTSTQNTTIDGGSTYTTTFTGSRTFSNSSLIAENTSSGRGISGITSTGTGVHGSSASSGVGVLGVSSSGYGVWAESATGQAFYALSPSTDGVGVFVANPSTTNTTHTLLNLTRSSTSAGANNIAGSIDFNINNTTGAGSVTLANRLISKLTTATASSEVSQFEIWGVNAGSQARKFAIAGTGQITEDGYGSNAFTVTPATTPVYSSTGVKGERIAPEIYTALLSQTGTSNPTVTILGTNEIGSIAWSRNSTGNYSGSLASAFPGGKTWAIVQRGDMTGTVIYSILSRVTDSTINLAVTDATGAAVDGFTNMSIEIRVYP